MAVKLKNGGFQGKAADKWYVTDGMNAVGPVELTLLVRGVEAGRVPLDSFVRHEAWKVWRPLADFAESDGVAEPMPTMPHPLSSLLEQERAIAGGSAFGDTGELLDDSPSTGEVLDDSPSTGEVLDDSPSTGEYGDRLTIEVLSEMAPSTDHAPSMADDISVEVPTKLSGDLLGNDRPTLASYMEDEETKIPEKKLSPAAFEQMPVVVAPRAVSSPSRLPSAPPRPASYMPPRPASFHPPPNSGLARAGELRESGLLPFAARSSSKPGTEPLVTDDDDDDEGKTSPSVKPPRIPPPGSLPEVRVDELDGAVDLADALHLLLDSLVRHVRAEAALLHRMADDGATVVCAQGPNMVDVLGSRVRLLDPALVAAAGGNVVVAEPAPGPAGDVLLARLRKLGLDAEGAAMLPIRPKSRLLGFVEIGKAQRFSFRELAIAEELVALFVTKAEQSGWS